MVDFLQDFRDNRYALLLARQIRELAADREMNLMEICGGHTIAIFKFGIKDLLPGNIHLLSGPGCPVCVTANTYIDKAVDLCRRDDTIVCTFGDMMRVPGSRSSLLRERAAGRAVRVCLSATEAVKTAREHPDKRVVFLGIGFETTAPTIAASIRMAEEQGLTNFFVLSALKTMPRALAALIGTEEFNVQGFLCPGHVTTITGTAIYRQVTDDYKIPCVVSGFEPLDILQSVKMLVEQIASGRSGTAIQYTRSVTTRGNPVAKQLMREVFQPYDADWRGIGVIPGSGLKIRKAFARFDADRQFTFDLPPSRTTPGCICGAIMRGVKTPLDCSLFAGTCTPVAPQGACMVSGEGTCATYYKYNRGKNG